MQHKISDCFSSRETVAEKRISEYISAWRRYDKLVTYMIGKFPSYDGKPGKCPLILDEVANISKEISEIEHSITSDES